MAEVWGKKQHSSKAYKWLERSVTLLCTGHNFMLWYWINWMGRDSDTCVCPCSCSSVC